WLHRICKYCAALGVLLLLACALVTVADVVCRRTINWSIPGLVDLTQLLVMSSVFLCIPFAFERRANVEVDLLYVRLPSAVRSVLSVLWPLLGAAFLLMVAWHAGQAASQVLEYGETSATLNVPMIGYWAPMLFGTILAAVVCLVHVARPAEATEDGATASSNPTSPSP